MEPIGPGRGRMMGSVRVDGPRPARAQMAEDESRAREAVASVRLYWWDPPAFSVGWKQEPPAWLHGAARTRRELEVVERPTAGGIACHGTDVSCGIVVPHAVEPSGRRAAAKVCETLAALCRSLGVEAAAVMDVRREARVTVCLAEPSPYGLVWAGRKLAGLAIRRYASAWLIQGSLLVRPLPATLREVMPPDVLQGMARGAVSLAEAAGQPRSVEEVASRWAAQWESLAPAVDLESMHAV